MNKSVSDEVRVVRHGDVILVKMDATPAGADLKTVAADNGKVVLAYGEVTGHSHSIDAKNATLTKTKFTDKMKPYLGLISPHTESMESAIAANGGDVEFLHVKSGGDILTHQEHPVAPLEEGVWMVVHQQEYSPGAVKQVRD